MPKLNPYINNEQPLSITLPDSGDVFVSFSGWSFVIRPPIPGVDGALTLTIPDFRDLRLGWRFENDVVALQFQAQHRLLDGVELVEPALGLKQTMTARDGGRSLECEVSGPSGRTLEATLEIPGPVGKIRGIAADRTPWEITKSGATLLLPWGETWEIQTDGEITPVYEEGMRVTIAFPSEDSRKFKILVGPRTDKQSNRGVDFITESDSVNRALALLSSLIPPPMKPDMKSTERFEFWSDLTPAQWYVHADAVPEYFDLLRVPEEQVWVLEYGLKAFETVYRWGTVPAQDMTAYQPLMDDALNRLDSEPRQVVFGTTIEDRYREAAVWLFAETCLAPKSSGDRSSYRRNSREASKDALRSLRMNAEDVEWKESVSTPDSLLFVDRFIDPDVRKVTWGDGEGQNPFIQQPDTLEVFAAAARGTLSWLNEDSKIWLERSDLPWELEMASLRWNFDRQIRFRRSDHWQRAFETLFDPRHPVLLPGETDRASQYRAAAGELETIVESYLGIRPNRSVGKIVFDPRLPNGWGRTRARVPFCEGELFVDYDLAEQRAWIAARGLTQSFECIVYLPTASGAISAEFTLEPGDGPHFCRLELGTDNATRLFITTSSLPE
ncbi:MAG: hypothetical protein H6506_01675 [Calditrichaeota bacterium]|nr:hypothetical protein [Calditrichota bacterium]MCB9367374.1 hypothetical protein [Calditrichota bacterium]MCB9391340.1 hypothetical protein [Calditrichota bacterium]